MTEQEYAAITKRIQQLTEKAKQKKLSQSEAAELQALLSCLEKYEAQQ